ncbi:MAG: chorismate mutase [Chthoniobacterales bacterium]
MKTLSELRAAVDQIDKVIIEQLAHRDVLSANIGLLKHHENQPIHDMVREEALKKEHASLATSHGLDPLFIEKLFAIILKHSKEIQKNK